MADERRETTHSDTDTAASKSFAYTWSRKTSNVMKRLLGIALGPRFSVMARPSYFLHLSNTRVKVCLCVYVCNKFLLKGWPKPPQMDHESLERHGRREEKERYGQKWYVQSE